MMTKLHYAVNVCASRYLAIIIIILENRVEKIKQEMRAKARIESYTHKSKKACVALLPCAITYR